jgi:hypothetical protein
MLKDEKFMCFNGISYFKKIIIFNALLPLVLTFSFPYLNLTLILAPLQPKCMSIASNISVREMRLKSKLMIEHIY